MPVSPSNEKLRDIDRAGYEGYRYLLDLIYNSGSTHTDHYRLKDQVDKYIVSLFSNHLNATLKSLIDEAPKKKPLEIRGAVEHLGYEPSYEVNELTARLNAAWNDAIAAYTKLIESKKR